MKIPSLSELEQLADEMRREMIKVLRHSANYFELGGIINPEICDAIEDLITAVEKSTSEGVKLNDHRNRHCDN